MVNPAGGNPAAITSLPGLGGALGALSGRLATFTAELPGQSAQFRTPPLDASTLVTGAPRVAITVARAPGQPAPAQAVLYGKTYEVTPGGLRTLLGGAVAPIRVAGARRRLARGRRGDAARGRRPDRGRQPAGRLVLAPPTRGTRASSNPRCGSIGLVPAVDGLALALPVVPGEHDHREHRATAVR